MRARKVVRISEIYTEISGTEINPLLKYGDSIGEAFSRPALTCCRVSPFSLFCLATMIRGNSTYQFSLFWPWRRLIQATQLVILPPLTSSMALLRLFLEVWGLPFWRIPITIILHSVRLWTMSVLTCPRLITPRLLLIQIPWHQICFRKLPLKRCVFSYWYKAFFFVNGVGCMQTTVFCGGKKEAAVFLPPPCSGNFSIALGNSLPEAKIVPPSFSSNFFVSFFIQLLF